MVDTINQLMKLILSA